MADRKKAMRHLIKEIMAASGSQSAERIIAFAVQALTTPSTTTPPTAVPPTAASTTAPAVAAPLAVAYSAVVPPAPAPSATAPSSDTPNPAVTEPLGATEDSTSAETNAPSPEISEQWQLQLITPSRKKMQKFATSPTPVKDTNDEFVNLDLPKLMSYHGLPGLPQLSATVDSI